MLYQVIPLLCVLLGVKESANVANKEGRCWRLQGKVPIPIR